jgi:hypothetical protein
MARRRFDDWGRPRAAFSFRDLERAADAAAIPPGGTVIDPFAGSGSTGTFVTARGEAFLGIEAHRLIGELATLKNARVGPPQELREVAGDLRERATGSLGEVDLDREDPVVQRFVPRKALRELVALRDAARCSASEWDQHLRWLIVGLLRQSSGSGWPYPSPAARQQTYCAPLEELPKRVEEMAADLSDAPRRPCARVVVGDARSDEAWRSIPLGTIHASVSSPPYLNQVSYAEVTRLELHFLGIVRSWREMTTLIGSPLVASCTQQVTVGRARLAMERLERFQGTAAIAGLLGRRLRRERDIRPRGKAYDLLLPTYLADLSWVLEHLCASMVPGGRAAWVIGDSAPYGVQVDTPTLVGLLAEDVGFELLDDVLLRERGSRWNGVGGRRARHLTERMIVFRRPAFGEQHELPGLVGY